MTTRKIISQSNCSLIYIGSPCDSIANDLWPRNCPVNYEDECQRYESLMEAKRLMGERK